MNREFRSVLKNKGSFPTEDAAMKLMFLKARKIEKTFAHRNVSGWDDAQHGMEVMYAERFSKTKNPQTQ